MKITRTHLFALINACEQSDADLKGLIIKESLILRFVLNL